jgi:hypothetical protein
LLIAPTDDHVLPLLLLVYSADGDEERPLPFP